VNVYVHDATGYFVAHKGFICYILPQFSYPADFRISLSGYRVGIEVLLVARLGQRTQVGRVTLNWRLWVLDVINLNHQVPVGSKMSSPPAR